MRRTFKQTHAPRNWTGKYSRTLPSGWAYVVDDAGNHFTDEAGIRLIVQVG